MPKITQAGPSFDPAGPPPEDPTLAPTAEYTPTFADVEDHIAEVEETEGDHRDPKAEVPAKDDALKAPDQPAKSEPADKMPAKVDTGAPTVASSPAKPASVPTPTRTAK